MCLHRRLSGPRRLALFDNFAKSLTWRAVLAALCASPVVLIAAPAKHHYTLVDLGTLGGTQTVGEVMNDRGDVTGYSTLRGDASYHAFRFNGREIEDLGTLGGTNSEGVAINHSGQVTGTADTRAGGGHAFVSTPRRAMIDLGTLGGTQSAGTSINDAGQITGAASTAGDVATRAFLYSGGTMIDLGTLGGAGSSGVAINSAGQVAGTSDMPPAFFPSCCHAFISNSGSTLVDLGTLGDPTVEISFATAINSAGEVSGNGSLGGEESSTHAFLYENGAMRDLGVLGNLDSVAEAMNDLGQVTGESQPPDSNPTVHHAFLYANGRMKDLGILGPDCPLACESSAGHTINDFGEVGGDDFRFDIGSRAFIYSNGRMTDLNSLLSPQDANIYTLTDAVAINNVGQILVRGIVNSTNAQHSFVLTCKPRRRCGSQFIPGN
jgi:probable HAF family extracellular repeat protein